MRRSAVLLVVAPLALGLSSACSYDWTIGGGDPGGVTSADGGADGTTSPTAVECGLACVCQKNDVCAFKCSGATCALSCEDSSVCTFDCSGTNCGVTCRDSATCTMNCTGLNCAYDCKQSSTCNGTCSGNCSRDCESTCNVECTGLVCQ